MTSFTLAAVVRAHGHHAWPLGFGFVLCRSHWVDREGRLGWTSNAVRANLHDIKVWLGY